MQPIIQLKNIVKEFQVPRKIENPTFLQKVKSIFHRQRDNVKILHDITMDVKQGEFIGYLGPNGAGKSTTIKVLTGVLTPTSGTVKVAGFIPYKERYKYTYHIGVVFGHRTLLDWDIPVIESLLLYKDIYELSRKQFDERIAYFSKILKIDRLLHIPVRKLSLGERMRCEIAASLLHKPKVVFLDEPTIGLDAVAKEEIRQFLKTINKKEKTTILLTTHDMDDIEALCKRIVIIDEGKMIYDGTLAKLKKNYIKHKTVEFQILKIRNKTKFNKLLKKVDVVKKKNNYMSLRVPINEVDVPDIIGDLMHCCTVIDLLVHEPRLEHIIKEIYEGQEDAKKEKEK